MRKIGQLGKTKDAERFGDYLYSLGIRNAIESEPESDCEIWVHDEEQLKTACHELEAFVADPEAAKYEDARKDAEARRHEEAEAEAAYRKKVFDRKRIERRSFFAATPITLILIAISVVVTLLGGLGSDTPVEQWLSITSYQRVEGGFLYEPSLPEIQQGQIWRLVTPIFLHASLLGSFGFLHLLFNMLWLKELGQMLERVQGKRGMLTKVLVLAVLSNAAQFALSGPAFGGMSGVVFGLLGYNWMRGRFDLTSGLFVPNPTILMMTAWFFFCLFGFMGAIANAAHGVGLVSGIAWGYLSAHRVNAQR